MGEYLLGASLYFQRVVDPAEGLALIRRAIYTLGEYHGAPLRPTSPEQTAMLSSLDLAEFETSGYLLTTNHEALAAEIGRSSFPVNITYVEPGRDITQIQIFFAVLLDRRGLPQVWHYGLDWMPLFAEATAASLAVLNAIPDDDRHPDYLPDERLIRPGALPPFFGPWNYLGPDRLDEERRKFLNSLPAAKSAPSGEGWVLQVVHELQDSPPLDFLERLTEAPERMHLEYRQPKILS